MPDLLTLWEFIKPALFIFTLRVMAFAFFSLRIKMVAEGKKALSWVFAIIQASIAITTFIIVISDLGNWLKLISYAAGFATGIVVGMIIEEKLAMGYTLLRVISPGRGAELIERLRNEGYAVTEVAAQGKNGTVTLLNCNVRRMKSRRVEEIIMNTDSDAFITALPVRPVQKGFWGNRQTS